MLRFFQRHKNTLIAGSAAATKVVADNYWVWANTSMGTEGETDAGKHVWNVVLVLLAVGMWGMSGKAADIAKRIAAERPELPTFFARNANKLTGGFLGMAFSMINNYWIFTGMSMPGSEIPEDAKKALYYIAEIVAAASLGGELGNIVDHLQKLTPSAEIEMVAEQDDYQPMQDDRSVRRLN
ncbi:MAG: hypothetical protein P4M14_09775 [Gammaproteobacteria bacterium]|nr:hypothetical protein [Gammaproteobacteria bacterium]